MGQRRRALLDTGSHVNLIRRDTYTRLRNKGQLDKNNKICLQGVNGGKLKVYGKVEIPFSMGGVKMVQPFHVVEEMNRAIILGRQWMMCYGVRMYFDTKKNKNQG